MYHCFHITKELSKSILLTKIQNSLTESCKLLCIYDKLYSSAVKEVLIHG